MKKKNRLIKNEDFKKVLDAHKCVSRENIKIFYKINDLDYLRVGVSVSSKIANAVNRHKIKRQINAMIKDIIDINTNMDILIIVKDKYKIYSYNENLDIIKTVLLSINRKGERINEKN